MIQENETAKPEKAMKSSDVIEFFNRAMVNNTIVNEPLRLDDGDTEYDTILNSAIDLNKQLWDRVNSLLEQYGFEQIDDVRDIGDNNTPPDDPRFILLRKLGEKLSPEEWKEIKITVDRLLELLSKAHELNNFDMHGEENNLKHPVQFGIIVNIIDPLSWKYE